MPDPLNPPDFQQADADLTQLFEEVSTQVGYMAGGITLSPSAVNIKDLFDTRVSFGNPQDNLVRLTAETFQMGGTELKDIYKQQMQDKYHFYYLTITVALIPKPATRFWRLTCQLDFEPKGSNEPIIQTIFPTQEWRSVFNFGVGMDVGLDGNLEWSGAVDTSQIPLPVEGKAKIVNKNAFQGFIGIPSFKYELGNPEILAVGENNSFAYWRIEDKEIQKIGTAKFALVFKVPQGVDTITLVGKAWAEPDMNWLTADIKDVASALSENLKNIFRNREEGASRFARGIGEKWELDLSGLNK
jgi:hypothetical protein